MTDSAHPAAPSAEDVVRGFLRDVRSGRHLDRAGRYLAARVRAHQGRPGTVSPVVRRTPGQYADHVRDMLHAVGPWEFEVLDVGGAGDLVEAGWRQTGVLAEGPDRGRTVVEHGRATYRVRGGRITEYWIEFRQEVAPVQRARGPAVPRGGHPVTALPALESLEPLMPPTPVPPVTGRPTPATATAPAPAEVLRYAAFSTDPRGGNPAGVVLDAGGMTPGEMLATAAEVGFSETAFLDPRGGSRFDVRYFSPRAEVSFCGHATIAAAVAHAERHGPGRLHLDTAAGPVEVRTGVGPDGSWQARLTSVPPRTADLAAGDRHDLLAALHWSEDDLDPALPVRVAYAGAWHPVVAAATRERLADLDYDTDALGALMARRDWTTVALVWREDATTFHARNPFPPGGVVEDPATGAAAAALGGLLREQRLVSLPATLTVLQGADMGRPSRLTVGIPADDTSGIDVSGNAVALPPVP